MVTILLFGSGKDEEMTSALLSAIKSCGKSALYVSGDSVTVIPEFSTQVDYTIVDNPGIVNVGIHKGIIIFKRNSEVVCPAEIPDSCIAVLEPDNGEAVAKLFERHIQTVTCGLSQKDTVTFSSLDTDGAVISLQRSIVDCFSKTAEPFEAPVSFLNTHTPYPVLASFAALLLSGADIPPNFKL